MLVVAPAGYGKTAALAQALDASVDATDRLDLWLQCEPADADPEHLVGGILRSAGLPTATGGDASIVAEALLRYAPREVCLVVDDVHDLPPDSAGARVLDDLADRLPVNVHLVLSGRTRPALRLARRQLAGEVEMLGRDDLAFDPDEIDRIGADTVDDPNASWPAWSALGNDEHSPVAVGTDYLIQEVVADFDRELVDTLTALAMLRHVDDGVVDAATNGAIRATELLDGLPLVHHTGAGAFQFHDLWRQALAPDDVLTTAAAEALTRIAEHVLAEGDIVGAAELFALAGQPDGVRRCAIELLWQPLTGLAATQFRQLHAWCRRAIPDDPVTEMFDAALWRTGDERVSVAAFEQAAAHARALGDVDLESLALQNVMNMQSVLDPTDFPDDLLARIEELAVDHPTMIPMAASIRAHRFRVAGDPERSAAELWAMGSNRSPMAAIGQAFGYGDLGRPEDVPMPAVDDDPKLVAAQAGGQYVAQAIWLRGEVTPELALELGSGLAAHADAFQIAHVQVSTNAVLALVAVAAGDHDTAQRFVERAAAASNQTAAGHVRSFAEVARAALVTSSGDEAGAEAVLGSALRRTPIGNWPPRPYLYSLPMVYALMPETRSTIDGCRFGPALTTATRAAQALVALRDRQDPRPAADLPWHRADLLRAHLLPPHLAELAAAAASVGTSEVELLLGSIPSLRDHLVRVAGRSHQASAEWARQRIVALPRRPSYDLTIELLGPTSLWRGSVRVEDAAWLRRDRVRELLAVLALNGWMSRQRVASLMWPELAEDRALSNLRVNLHHLQSVLQPERDDELPWFVQVTGDGLELARSGVTVDLDEFERAAGEARRLDDAGRSTAAIEQYQSAVARYRGDLMEDVSSASWADADRARLRALAIASMGRLGELMLARGEPEEAATCAADLLRLEPINERGARLLASCLEAQDDRVGAARTLRSVMAALADEGLQPERQTLDQAGRLGVV